MKPDKMHDSVHQKRRPGHVACIFKEGDTEEKNQNIRQENNNTSDTRNDAVDEKILKNIIRKHLGQRRGKKLYTAVDPLHWIDPQ